MITPISRFLCTEYSKRLFKCPVQLNISTHRLNYSVCRVPFFIFVFQTFDTLSETTEMEILYPGQYEFGLGNQR